MTTRHILSAALIALLVAVYASTSVGEIPNRSEKRLTESASHIVSGKVVRTYERTKKTSANFERTYGVAEISADDVKKGADIAPGDRVFVCYWRKRWIGQGEPTPDHYGHRNIPAEKDSVVVYLKGDRKRGFDVMSPNGFFAVTKATKNDET